MTQAAGERLADAMEMLAVHGPSGLELRDRNGEDADAVETFLEGLVRQLAGDGCSVADAAVRRAAVTAGRRLLREHPDLHEAIGSGGGDGRGLASDIVCSLYQWFFADVIGEFLKTALAENIKLAVPVLALQSPGDGIADHIADRIVKLVPNPCERVADATDLIETATDGDTLTVPVARVAKGLLSGTVRTVLGLASGEEATS
ncbi:hypothetical protein AN219_35840 [Streptomyces nanshensis]|nr:hypothetical protein AN219_35840 [Streptomyces nanshensis]